MLIIKKAYHEDASSMPSLASFGGLRGRERTNSVPLPYSLLTAISPQEFDNAVTDREAQPCAFTNSLGRIERVKDLLDTILRNPGPRVCKGYFYDPVFFVISGADIDRAIGLSFMGVNSIGDDV